MTVILSAFFFLGLFFLIAGCAFQCLEKQSRALLFASPAVGAALLQICVYVSLTQGGFTLKGAAYLAITLMLLGTFGWRTYLRKKGSADISVADVFSIFTLFACCTLPLFQHAVPPDVDAQYSATLASYLLAGESYPNLNLWKNDPYQVLLPDSFGLLLAAASVYSPIALPKIAIGLSGAFAASSLIALLPVAQEVLSTWARSWLCLALVVAFGFSSAFTWNFGDGSYLRLPAIAVFAAIPILWKSLDDGDSKAFVFLTPLLFASSFYSHQRYALLLSIFMMIVAGTFLIRGPQRGRRALMPITAAAGFTCLLVLPLASNFFQFEGLSNGTPIGNSNLNIPVREVYLNYVLKFHSGISWIVTFIGMAICVKHFKGNIYFNCAVTQLFIYFFFTNSIIINALPASIASLAYPKVVALDPVLFCKFFFSSVFSIWITRRFQLFTKEFHPLRIGVLIVFLIFLATLSLLEIVLMLQERVLFQKFIFNFLPTPFATIWLSGAAIITAAFAGGLVFFAGSRRDYVFGFPSTLFIVAALLWSADIAHGKINLPYYSDNLGELADWIRHNTDQDSTLLFKGCNVDPFGTDISVTRASASQGMVVYQWELDWLPALSGRKSTCNRLHLVGYKSAIFDRPMTPPDGFYEAHKLIYGSGEVSPINHFSALGITHVIVSRKTKILGGLTQQGEAFLKKVYQQEGDQEYAVYEVLSD